MLCQSKCNILSACIASVRSFDGESCFYLGSNYSNSIAKATLLNNNSTLERHIAGYFKLSLETVLPPQSLQSISTVFVYFVLFYVSNSR